MRAPHLAKENIISVSCIIHAEVIVLSCKICVLIIVYAVASGGDDHVSLEERVCLGAIS